MTRIVVLSDTHYRNSILDNSIINLISSYDHVIHAGDYINDGIEEEFESHCSFFGVAGNGDSWKMHNKLGRKKLTVIDGIRIGICHGDIAWMSPLEAAKNIFKDIKTDIVVFGHSHFPLVRYEGSVLYVNPGSYTQPRGGSARSFAVITITDGKVLADIRQRLLNDD